MAPKSSNETRSLIGSEAQEETDHLKLQAARLRDSATEFIEKVRHDVTRKEDLHDAVEAGTNGHRESAHIGNASAAGAAWVQ